MADDVKIDFSRFTAHEEVSKKVHPERETRPQYIKEAAPDYQQRAAEREGRSEFSGGWAGGGTWAGRSR
jgi:hypothetical protein